MALDIGQRRNTNDSSTTTEISLNASTSTTVKAAGINFIVFTFSNPSSKKVLLKLQAASVDNLKEGIVVFPKTVYEMPTGNLYTGEISAISESGTPDIFVTQY